MAEYKRRIYLVKRAYQLKFTGIILLFIFLTVFLTGAIAYVTVFPYLSKKLANVYPQSRLILILADANLRLLYSLLVLTPLAIWIGTLLSHKVAGPWHRLENILLDMAEGNIGEEIKLRKGDELRDLADALNKVTARLRMDKSQTVEQLDTLQQNLTELQEELNRTEPDLAKTRELISKLQDSANKIKG